jgi:hypothetical protein
MSVPERRLNAFRRMLNSLRHSDFVWSKVMYEEIDRTLEAGVVFGAIIDQFVQITCEGHDNRPLAIARNFTWIYDGMKTYIMSKLDNTPLSDYKNKLVLLVELLRYVIMEKKFILDAIREHFEFNLLTEALIESHKIRDQTNDDYISICNDIVELISIRVPKTVLFKELAIVLSHCAPVKSVTIKQFLEEKKKDMIINIVINNLTEKTRSLTFDQLLKKFD